MKSYSSDKVGAGNMPPDTVVTGFLFLADMIWIEK